MKFNFLHN